MQLVDRRLGILQPYCDLTLNRRLTSTHHMQCSEDPPEGGYLPMKYALCNTKATSFHRSSTIHWVDDISANGCPLPYRYPAAARATKTKQSPCSSCAPGGNLLYPFQIWNMDVVMPIARGQLTRLTLRGRGSRMIVLLSLRSVSVRLFRASVEAGLYGV